jgi:hypothetical protein
MIKFIPTVKEDVNQIQEWTAADLWHQNQKQPEWWLTGSDAYVCACVQDEIGPVLYLKVEEEETAFRLHCQFGPRSEVNRKRLLVAMNEGLPPVLMYLLNKGKSVIFNSLNPSLVKFMQLKGFKPDTLGVSGDYVLKCEAEL